MAIALLSASALAQTVPMPREVAPPKWGPHVDFEGKAGNKRNIGEADAFVPIWQNDDTLVFGNVKTRLDDDESREGNFGAGVRHMLPSGWNVGAYGYFDRRKTEHDNYFNQVTLGGEALSLDWDLRANFYLPEGRRTKNADALNTAEISGTSVIFRGGEERSMRGFDGEIGWRAPVFDLDAGRALRIYGGAYRFYADGVDPVQGPRARAELTFDEVPGLWQGSRLTLGAEAQHDGPRGGQVFAVARLRIPLQIFGEPPSRLTPLERRMTDPIVRDVDVVSQAGAFGAPETATQLAGGTSFSVINSSSTTSAAALNTAISTAGDGSTVLLSGTFDTGSTTVATAFNQTLMAGSIAIRSPSGRLATVSTLATLTGTNAASTTGVLRVRAGSVAQGLTVTANANDGNATTAIRVDDNAGSASLINNTITVNQTAANVGTAVVGGSNTSFTVTGNTITVTGSGGATTLNGFNMAGSNAAQTLNFANNAVSVAGGTTNNAIGLAGGTGNLTINAASTGNVLSAGTCSGTGTITGSVSFTDGTTCP